MGCSCSRTHQDSPPIGNMASPSAPPFMTRQQFADMALNSVQESYGDKFDFELDSENFCILFKNKLNPENIGKMYLQNRYQCMLSYGPDINTEKVKEIINDSTDGLTFYSQPAMSVDAADLRQLYPMIKTPQWFESYQETMISHGCKETIFQDAIEVVEELVAMTLALNYGKFRRYVTREEVAEWGKNFELDALKEAKKNLKGRISEMGSIKKAWEKPVQGTSVYRAKLPDELSASLICLPETIKKLKVKGDHVAMLPVASVLYVTGSKDEDGLRLMTDLALDYLNYPHFLTLQPIRLASKNEIPGKGHHWTLFQSAIVEAKMQSASVNLFVSPKAKKEQKETEASTASAKSRPASFFSALSSKINAGLRSPKKSKKANGSVSAPAPLSPDEDDSLLSNGHSLDIAVEQTKGGNKNNGNGSVIENNGLTEELTSPVTDSAVYTEADAGSIDSFSQGDLLQNDQNSSKDDFVHVEHSMLHETQKQELKKIAVDVNHDVIVHEIVPEEVQMQLLASAIDGEEITVHVNSSLHSGITEKPKSEKPKSESPVESDTQEPITPKETEFIDATPVPKKVVFEEESVVLGTSAPLEFVPPPKAATSPEELISLEVDGNIRQTPKGEGKKEKREGKKSDRDQVPAGKKEKKEKTKSEEEKKGKKHEEERDDGSDDRDGSGRRNDQEGVVEFAQAQRKLGLLQDEVWLERPRYEEAEMAFAVAVAKLRPLTMTTCDATFEAIPMAASSAKLGSPVEVGLSRESIWFDKPKFEEAFNNAQQIESQGKRVKKAPVFAVSPLTMESIWFDQSKYEEAFQLFALTSPSVAPAAMRETVPPRPTSLGPVPSSSVNSQLPYPFYISPSYGSKEGLEEKLSSKTEVMTRALSKENVWFDASVYEDALIKKATKSSGVVENESLQVIETEKSDVPTLEATAECSQRASSDGLRKETVWLDRHVYEAAEASYQKRNSTAKGQAKTDISPTTKNYAQGGRRITNDVKEKKTKKENQESENEVEAAEKAIEKEKLEEDDEVDAFDLFTAVPIGSAAREVEKAAEKQKEEDKDEFGAFELFTAVPIGSAAREAEKAAEKEKDEDEFDAFDLFTAVPIGSAAREAEKVAEKEKQEYEDEFDAFDLFTAVPIGSAAREAEKEAEKEKQKVEIDAFDLFTAVPFGSAAREAEKAAEKEKQKDEFDAVDLFTAVPIGSAAREAEKEKQKEEDEDEFDAFDLFTAVPIGSAAREAEKLAEIATGSDGDNDEVDAFDLFTAVPLGSAAVAAEKAAKKAEEEEATKLAEIQALENARKAAANAQKAILAAKEILAEAQRPTSKTSPSKKPIGKQTSFPEDANGGETHAALKKVFDAEPVGAAAFEAEAKMKRVIKSPSPVERTIKEQLPAQESFTFKANSPAKMDSFNADQAHPQRKTAHPNTKEKSPLKPIKKKKEECKDSYQDGDVTQSRKRKANSQIQKGGGATPPPPRVSPAVKSDENVAPTTNGHKSTSESPKPKDKIFHDKSAAPVTTLDAIPAASTPAFAAEAQDQACENLFGEDPIVLNERTLRLLGLSESGWNSMLLKSRLSGGVLPLDTTFICFECGRDAVAEKNRLMKCKRCKVASYCDKNCQGTNWGSHKHVCKVVGAHRHADEIPGQNIVCK